MEPLFIKTYEVTAAGVDRFGQLKASRLLECLQEVSGAHSNLLGVGRAELTAQNLFWAVIRHRVQITRLPGNGEKLRIETWPMPTTRTAYPRSVVAYDENGNECFRSISLWVLMDEKSRAMILPGKSGVEVSGFLRGNELSAPGGIMPRQMVHRDIRPVRYTDLDMNGHMNNCRYLDWIEDLLPSSFHQTHQLREFTLCYLSEIRENEEMALHWEISDQQTLAVEAIRNDDPAPGGHQRVFSAQLQWENVVL